MALGNFIASVATTNSLPNILLGLVSKEQLKVSSEDFLKKNGDTTINEELDIIDSNHSTLKENADLVGL